MSGVFDCEETKSKVGSSSHICARTLPAQAPDRGAKLGDIPMSRLLFHQAMRGKSGICHIVGQHSNEMTTGQMGNSWKTSRSLNVWCKYVSLPFDASFCLSPWTCDRYGSWSHTVGMQHALKTLVMAEMIRSHAASYQKWPCFQVQRTFSCALKIIFLMCTIFFYENGETQNNCSLSMKIGIFFMRALYQWGKWRIMSTGMSEEDVLDALENKEFLRTPVSVR